MVEFGGGIEKVVGIFFGQGCRRWTAEGEGLGTAGPYVKGRDLNGQHLTTSANLFAYVSGTGTGRKGPKTSPTSTPAGERVDSKSDATGTSAGGHPSLCSNSESTPDPEWVMGPQRKGRSPRAGRGSREFPIRAEGQGWHRVRPSVLRKQVSKREFHL